ncbi:hypothetical protein PRZ48_009979 [Zasmidium cellare]|uniref:Uncharacterized protein n=1 Tax=Zasmidium cellare TaxID=395010 RepID=A0ABR0ED82_ZASCE|nr:hypothetical protein PRZ48_009979 [Zasmidium cellare]
MGSGWPSFERSSLTLRRYQRKAGRPKKQRNYASAPAVPLAQSISSSRAVAVAKQTLDLYHQQGTFFSQTMLEQILPRLDYSLALTYAASAVSSVLRYRFRPASTARAGGQGLKDYVNALLIPRYVVPQQRQVQEQQREALDEVLRCWQTCMETQRFAKSMSTTLFPLYGALKQMDSYRGLPIEDVVSWLEYKSIIAFGHVKGFSGENDLAATWDMYCGGAGEKSIFKQWA